MSTSLENQALFIGPGSHYRALDTGRPHDSGSQAVAALFNVTCCMLAKLLIAVMSVLAEAFHVTSPKSCRSTINEAACVSPLSNLQKIHRAQQLIASLELTEAISACSDSL